MWFDLAKGKSTTDLNILVNNLAFISIFVALCGTNWIKRKEHTIETLVQEIIRIKSDYSIIDNRKDAKYLKGDSTLARMAAIMPWYGVSAAQRNYDDLNIQLNCYSCWNSDSIWIINSYEAKMYRTLYR